MFWVAAVWGQILVGVCWLGVEVRVDLVSLEYYCRVQKRNFVDGMLCSEFNGWVEQVDLLQETVECVLAVLPDSENVVNVAPPRVWSFRCPCKQVCLQFSHEQVCI